MTWYRHRENFWAFTGPRRDFGLILLISNMIIHRSFTSPTHLLSSNVRGTFSFAVSVIKMRDYQDSNSSNSCQVTYFIRPNSCPFCQVSWPIYHIIPIRSALPNRSAPMHKDHILLTIHNRSTLLTHWGIYIYIYVYASINLLSLVQIMACCLIGTKPLSEPMLDYG